MNTALIVGLALVLWSVTFVLLFRWRKELRETIFRCIPGSLLSLTLSEMQSARFMHFLNDLHSAQAGKLLNQAVGDGIRYQVILSDWDGQVSADMRWRWVILDADRFLRMETYSAGGDPQGDYLGITEPYMLGNAPTRATAEAEALSWIAQRRDNFAVTE